VDVLIQLSPSLSPSSLLDSDSAFRDATDGTLVDPSRSPTTNLVDLKETK